MKEIEITHAYVGFRRCGHAGFLMIDDSSKMLANEIAKLIKRGWSVERKTLDEARATPLTYCDCEQVEPVRGRKPGRPDRRQVERRAEKRRTDDKRKARLKR
jgi:hypothetical protein